MAKRDMAKQAVYRREWEERNRLQIRIKVRAERKERRELLNALKGRPCADCGIQYPPYVMDFDHVHGIKKIMMSQMNRNSTRMMLIEAAKCDVVCSNCHRIRTHQRKQEPKL